MRVLKNDVGRPSNKTIVTRNILKAILVIVLAAAIFVGGYLLNDYQRQDGNNKNENQAKDEKKEKIELSVEDAEGILYGAFDDFFYFSIETFNSDTFKTYVALKKTTPQKLKYTCKELFGNDIEPFDDSGETWTIPFNGEGLSGLMCYDGDNNEYYDYNSVNDEYHKLFGENSNAIKDFVSYGLADNFGYSSRKDVYMFLSCECGDGGFLPIYGITNAYEQDNKLYISFVYSRVDDNNQLLLSDDTTVKLTAEELESKETYKKYSDKLDKYTFIFEKTDNGYIFEKVK